MRLSESFQPLKRKCSKLRYVVVADLSLSAGRARRNAPSPKPRAPRHMTQVLETYCDVEVATSTMTLRVEVAVLPQVSVAT